jgi:hypothetical protein
METLKYPEIFKKKSKKIQHFLRKKELE